ncbi:MAG: hypothetical protein VX115_02770, partial [Candidatus Thermoplasmatota archaeon]|nr:hypothetical protein [Candidatus Thermoplasmatota archaeon]
MQEHSMPTTPVDVHSVFSPQLFGSKPVTVHVRSAQEAAPFHFVVPIWLDSQTHAYPSFVDPSTHVAPEPHET